MQRPRQATPHLSGSDVTRAGNPSLPGSFQRQWKMCDGARHGIARMRWRHYLETNLMESAGCQSYVRIVPVRGTFRTGERTFQCKRSMPVPPLSAQ
jgi:hypothetical protein